MRTICFYTKEVLHIELDKFDYAVLLFLFQNTSAEGVNF